MNFQAIPKEIYDDVLNSEMRPLPQKEIDFFVNERRFDLLKKSFPSNSLMEMKSILDVACGPFSFENFVQLSANCRVDAFDMNSSIKTVHKKFQNLGYLKSVAYQEMTLENFASQKKYDLVLMNDVFYLTQLDFYSQISRYCEMVRNEGYIYFDLLDTTNAWLWRLTNKDQRFARYEIENVFKELSNLGFVNISNAPSLGIKGGIDKFLRTILLSTTGATNNHVFLFQKVK